MNTSLSQLIVTADGSHTLFVPALNEHYHSVYGAMQESMHVFIHAGLSEAEKDFNSIHLLEIGFGTGLNCLLTYFNHHLPVEYIGVEAFPVEESILGKLNYHQWLHYRDSQRVFQLLHTPEWNKPITLSRDFCLIKCNSRVEHLTIDQLRPYAINLIYYDAFGPAVQPEMWTREIFDKLFEIMQSRGILVTYCAKGEVRRCLKAAGFVVENLKGPRGKREMTRAIKP